MVNVIEELRKQSAAKAQPAATFPVERETQSESEDDAKLMELMQKLEAAVTEREKAIARAELAEQKVKTLQEQHDIVIESMRENLRLASARNIQLDETNIEMKGKVSSSANRIAELEGLISRLNQQLIDVTNAVEKPETEDKEEECPDFEFIPEYNSLGKTVRVKARAIK